MPLQRQLRNALRPTVQRWRKRLDNPEVRQARLLAARVRTQPFDVLHLGASESLFVGPDDDDQRTLPAMVTDLLAPELSTYSVAGPGYNPRLFTSYVDIVASHGLRPTVVVGLCIRLGVNAWSHHPEYSYQRPLSAIQRVDPKSPPWRFRAYVPLATDAQFAVHDKVPYPTLDGTRSIGEFRLTLKNPKTAGLSEVERLRWLFAFHHGTSDDLADPFLSQVRAFGARLQQLGLPVVVYQMPVPVVRASEVLGDALREQTVKNLALMDEAFREGYGPIDILQTGASLQPEEFIDPNDGSEHVNERGRMRIARMIAEAVQAQKPPTPQR